MKVVILIGVFACCASIGLAARTRSNFGSIIIDDVEYFYDKNLNPVSKTDAEDECIAQSACLAELENPTREFLNSLARELPANFQFWIAGEIEPSPDPIALPCGGGSIDWANMDQNLIDIPSTSCLAIDRKSDVTTSKITVLPCTSLVYALCSYKLGGGGDIPNPPHPWTLRV